MNDTARPIYGRNNHVKPGILGVIVGIQNIESLVHAFS
jgi:hypothetical protein